MENNRLICLKIFPPEAIAQSSYHISTATHAVPNAIGSSCRDTKPTQGGCFLDPIPSSSKPSCSKLMFAYTGLISSSSATLHIPSIQIVSTSQTKPCSRHLSSIKTHSKIQLCCSTHVLNEVSEGPAYCVIQGKQL